MGVPPKTRMLGEDVPSNLKLNSWKEIAAYLGRDPRTLQLWEKQQGFPVHRLNHRARASVYAFTAEVDAWLQQHSGEKAVAAAAQPGPKREIRRPQLLRLAVYAGAGVAFAALLLLWLGTAREVAPQTHVESGALAVLPFEEQASTDDMLAREFTRKITADLVRMGKERVVAQSAAGAANGNPPSLLAVTEGTHVAFILRGTVAELGGQMRATIEVVTAPAGTYVWGATYQRTLGDAARLPDEMAATMAADVTRKITGLPPDIDPSGSNAPPRARQLYLTGKFYFSQRDLAGLQKAIDFYSQALAIDPRYPDAYAGLAEAYDVMTDRGVLTDAEAFRRAKAAAQNALAIDPECAEAHNALAFALYRQDWDFARAEGEFREATELDPDSAVAHQWYGEFLGDLRRFQESIAELQKARQLDPLSAMVGSDLADGYLHAGRLAEADAELKRVLELYPGFLPAYRYQMEVALNRSDYAAAEKDAEQYFQSSGDRLLLDEVEIRRLAASRPTETRVALRRALAAPGAALRPYERARLEIAAGRTQEGYASLERAFDEHSWWLVTMMVDPEFAAVRTQPRFVTIARRVGLPVGDPPPAPALAMRSD